MLNDGSMEFSLLPSGAKAAHVHDTVEPWAIDDPNLPRIEGNAIAALRSAWNKLREDTFHALGLSATPGKAANPAFVFDIVVMLQRLINLQADFIAANSSPQSAFLQEVYASWVRGITNAAESIDQAAEAERVIAQARQATVDGLADSLNAALKKTTVRAYESDIVDTIKRGAYDGQNPVNVAATLRKRFQAHDYDWERLARSEIAAEQSQGQLHGFANMGVNLYDFDTNPDACKICKALAEKGPYRIGEGPVPVRDSHPNCRCAVAARLDETTQSDVSA